MRLLLDMNLPPSVANWLRSEGHDALHVRDLGLSGAPDSEIFARAAADGRIVVTFDLDFGEVAGLVRGAGAGAILLRLRLTTRRHLQERLRAVLSTAPRHWKRARSSLPRMPGSGSGWRRAPEG